MSLLRRGSRLPNEASVRIRALMMARDMFEWLDGRGDTISAQAPLRGRVMSEQATPHNLFADITPRPGAGALFIRLIGPTVGAREAPIVQGMTAPAIDGFG